MVSNTAAVTSVHAILQACPNPATYSDFASLYNMRLIEYIYSWVWRSRLDPKADVADYLANV